MHRTLCRPRALLLGGLLLALLATGRPDPLQAQIPAPTGSTPMIVPSGTTTRLQMSTKKAIKLVKSSRENVLGIKAPPGDPTTVELTGQEAGITHLELTDVDGKTETFDIIVQADVEFLKIQLKRLVPTANIEPIPISNNYIILRGTVNTLEDIPRVLQNAVTALPDMRFVPEMHVAGDQQVQLCVTVAQVSRSQLRSMAFNFLTNSKNFFLGSTVGNAVAEPPLVGIGGTLNVAQFGQTLSGVPGTPNGLPTNLLFGVIHNRWGFLGFLEALRTEGVVKTLNEPTLTTVSGRPASFLVGGEQAIPVPAGLGQIGVQFEEFGTRLNFIPIVLGDGKIRLEVEPEVSALNAANGTSIAGVVVPGRTTTRVNTTVELEDGQTFVIGGLVQKEITGQAVKTPVLGDLPFLGTFFSSKSYSEDETEMVILVTPHLVDGEDCAQAPKILPGEETRSPDDFELFLEGILEAPRGPRQVFEDHRYIAAYKNSPTASVFPCAGRTGDGGGPAGGCPACGDPTGGIVPPPLTPSTPTEAPLPAPKSLTPLPVHAAPPAPQAAGDAPPAAPPAPADEGHKAEAASPPPAPAPAPAPADTTKPAAPGGSLPADLPPAVTGPGDDPK